MQEYPAVNLANFSVGLDANPIGGADGVKTTLAPSTFSCRHIDSNTEASVVLRRQATQCADAEPLGRLPDDELCRPPKSEPLNESTQYHELGFQLGSLVGRKLRADPPGSLDQGGGPRYEFGFLRFERRCGGRAHVDH